MRGKSLSPGSYFKEKNLSQRIRQITATRVAFVAPFDKGPVMERTRVFDEQDFIEKFGPPDPNIPTHQCIIEQLKTGCVVFVTRIVQTDETKARPLTAGAYVTVDQLDAQTPIVSMRPFDDGTSEPQGIYDPLNNLGFIPGQPGMDHTLFYVCVANPGEWNNNVYVRIRPSLPAGVADWDDLADPYSFYIDVFASYRGPRQQPDESFLVTRSRKVDGYNKQMYIEDVVNRKSKLIRVRNNEYAPLIPVYNPSDCYFEGATNGDPVTIGRYKEGWQLYKDPEVVDVNVLCQGGAPRSFDEYQCAEIQHLILDICEDRMDCVGVLDIPENMQDTVDAIRYRREIFNRASSYGGIFTPNVTVRDPYNARDVSVPPSGFVSAAFAKTDNNFALWFAAAGMVRGSLPTVKYAKKYKQPERNALHDDQINTIRYFSDGSGYKIWGADTLEVEASALNYLPVRRLLCYIEKSVSIAAQYSVFNPNTSILWTKLTEMVLSFLKPIEAGQGLYWSDVICDDRNNTPDTIANGDVMLDAYLDPVIFAKRIHLNAVIVKTGGIAYFKEYAQALGRGAQ